MFFSAVRTALPACPASRCWPVSRSHLPRGAPRGLSLSLGGNLFFTAAAMVLLAPDHQHSLARAAARVLLAVRAAVSCVAAERRNTIGFCMPCPSLPASGPTCTAAFCSAPPSSLYMPSRECPDAVFRRLLLLATFINPYGWRLHEHVFTYLQNDYLMDHIAEFRSFSFHSAGAWYVELFLFVAVLGTLALLRQRAFGPALLALGLLHISLYSARHLPTAAVSVAAAVRCGADARSERLAETCDPCSSTRNACASSTERSGASSRSCSCWPQRGRSGALVRDGLVSFDSAKFPVRAANFLAQRIREPRLHEGSVGRISHLSFCRRTKVFIDGRSDFYGQDFLETYAEVADVKPGWHGVLKQYDVAISCSCRRSRAGFGASTESRIGNASIQIRSRLSSKGWAEPCPGTSKSF